MIAGTAWSNRAPVWCELACDVCCTTTAGRWVSTHAVPRAQMIKEATKQGWLFKHHEMWCSQECKQRKEDQDGQNIHDKPHDAA